MFEVYTEVARVIGQVTDLPAERISSESRFESFNEWTSYAALRLLSGIEQRFGVRLNLQEYFSIKDVGGLVDAVSGALGHNAPGHSALRHEGDT